MLSRVWTFPEMFVDVYVSKYLYFCDIYNIYICTINGFLLPKIQHSWYLKKQRQQKTDTKGLTVRHCNFFHVQIHCPCQWIMTLPPKILWPTALLNTWNIITFPKPSFYHTNHTFSHKYKCMNDGFLINQHADQKNFVPRRTQFYVENDFFKNSRFATAN